VIDRHGVAHCILTLRRTSRQISRLRKDLLGVQCKVHVEREPGRGGVQFSPATADPAGILMGYPYQEVLLKKMYGLSPRELCAIPNGSIEPFVLKQSQGVVICVS